MLKKLRAALGNAATWALTWAAWGFALTLGVYFLAPGIPLPLWTGFPLFAVKWQAAFAVAQYAGVFGFVGGVLFSGVLGVVYRRRTLDFLQASRLGAWGGVAGLLFPVALIGIGAALLPYSLSLGLIGTTILFYGVPGFVTAAATIRLAQRAEIAAGVDAGRLTGS